MIVIIGILALFFVLGLLAIWHDHRVPKPLYDGKKSDCVALVKGNGKTTAYLKRRGSNKWTKEGELNSDSKIEDGE